MFVKGVSGNPSGKPMGATSIRSRLAQQVFAKHNFDSLEESILLAKSFVTRIAKTRSVEEKTEYRKLLLVLLPTLIKYQYPQLKQIEHVGDVDVNVNIQAVLTEALTRAYGNTARPVLVASPDTGNGSRTTG
jgi:hypothetical protein